MNTKQPSSSIHLVGNISKVFFPLLAIGMFSSCNSRVVAPLDQSLNASTGQAITVDAKTKIDILFVIDESPSMLAEQSSLATNFATFSDFIFDDLRNAVDYRIAVTSTGSKVPIEEDPFGIFPSRLGAFVTKSGGDNAECVGEFTPVISPTSLGCAIEDDQCQRQALQQRFSCLAQVGTNGIVFERGLEAMRSSISCNGPNAGLFGACCVAEEGESRLVYDPLCRNQNSSSLADPEFLRPDAILVVVFITDEDDCSTFSDAPIDSPYATCSIDITAVNDALGSEDTAASRQNANALIYNAYSDSTYCAPGNPQACHAAECTNASGQVLDPYDCYFTRCALQLQTTGRSLDLNSQRACRQQGYKLAPVSYYQEFLSSLKVRPNEQILVANIVSTGLLTPSGFRLNFSDTPNPQDACNEADYLGANLDECCPEGNCGAISDINSCRGANDGTEAEGYSGWRYIDLMTAFGSNGLGCREGETEGCVNLCDPNLNAALGALRARVISAVGDYCVARRPSCLVNDPTTGDTRTCDETEQSRPEYYQLKVSQVCELSIEENGDCGLVGDVSTLGLGVDYLLDVNDSTCASGVRVQLTSPPKAGLSTKMELLQNLVIFDE